MRARALVPVVGAVAAGLLLASGGAGLAMQLGPDEGVYVIPAGHVDPAKIEKRIQARQASIERQALARFLKPANRQAFLRYLSGHADIDPSRVVFQRGTRNYAGPDCPGADWNCTNARQVVQISLRASDDDDDDDGGGSNRFRCSSSYGTAPVGSPTPGSDSVGPDVSCVVVQVRTSGSNNAECIQHTTGGPLVTQSCVILQIAGTGSNRAVIDQDVNRKDSGGEQDVLQTAELTQTAGVGSNRADVDQDVDLTMHGSIDQKQDAHQRAELDLTTGDGDNRADVRQLQDLDAHSKALDVDQRQNTEFDDAVDCVTFEEPEAPNSCARILMETDDGSNRLRLDQENDLFMSVPGSGENDDDDNGNSSEVVGFQQQGSCNHAGACSEGDEADGGTEAGIDLFATSGTTNSHASGSAFQDMPRDEPGIVQLQFADPWCCFGTTFQGESVRAVVDLEVDQDAGENAYQAGENGLGCIGMGGDCIAELEIENNDGKFRAEGRGPVLFANQDCRYFPPGEEEFSLSEEGPQCEGVEFTTTTETDTSTSTD